MASPIRKKRSQKKLSPLQKVKGLFIKAGLAKRVKKRDNKIYFQPLWLRLVAVFLLLVVSGWFTLVTGAYFFVKYQRDFPEVKYFDLAFPHRWEDYKTARGDYYVERAKELLEEGQFHAALHYLRVGVSHSPDNVDGRIALAQIHTARGRPDLGTELLKDRVWEHTDNQTYLSALFTSLFATHEDADIDEIGSRILGDDKERSSRNSLVAYAVATANFNRGNYDRAEQFINDFALYTSAPGSALMAQIHWEQGYRSLAIQRLHELISRTAGAFDEAYRLLIQYQWSEGQHDRALQTATLHSSHDPFSHRPRLGLIRIHHLRNDKQRLQHNIDSFFRLHGDEEPAILELAAFAAQNGPASLGQRIHEHAITNGMNTEPTLLAFIESHVVDGNPRTAIELAEGAADQHAEWTYANRTRLHAILAAAYLQLGNSERGDSHLTSLAARRMTPPRDLLVLAERLLEIEEHQRARQVLNQLRIQHPLHQEALSKLVQIDIETGNNRELMRNLNRLLSLRKPSKRVLESAHDHISSDLFLFEQNRGEILDSIEAAIAETPSPLASF